MGNAPTASHSLTVRLEIQNQPGMLGKVTSAIGKAGGDIGAIDLVEVRKKTIVRDLTFKASDEPHGQQVVERRSEEHTSELQSPCNLVCRLLLEKKKKTISDSVQSVQDVVPR